MEQEDPQERIQHQVNQLYEAIHRGDWRFIGELLTIISPDKYIDETQLALAKAIEVADVTAVELLLGQTGLSKQYIQSMDPEKAKLLPPIGVNIAYELRDTLNGFTPLTLAKALMIGKIVVGIKEIQERERGKRTKRTDNLQQIISLLLDALVIDNRITIKDVNNPINHQFYQIPGWTSIYNTPLCWAVFSQNYQAIDAALALGATFDYKSQNGHIPLNIAVNIKDLKLVEYLLKKGADPNLKGVNEQTALLRAVQMNNIPIIELLMQYGALVDIPSLGRLNTPFRQAMMMAIADNDFALLDAILKSRKVDLNKPQAVIDNPLLFAIDKGSPALVQYLINKGSDVNSRVDDVPLIIAAVEKDNVDIVKLLLDAGANPNAQDGKNKVTALHIAVRKQNGAMVKTLLLHGARADIASEGKETPFLLAVLHAGSPGISTSHEIVEMLIDRPEVTSSEKNKSLSLIRAKDGKPDLVKYLVKHGADPSSTLLYALLWAKEGLVKSLLENGANPYIEGNLGQNAITEAAKIGPEFLDLVIKIGKADINKLNSRNETPIENLRQQLKEDPQADKEQIDDAIALLKQYGAKESEIPPLIEEKEETKEEEK
jgi:ankyrin repeat protein